MFVATVAISVFCGIVFGRVVGNKAAQVWKEKENKGILPGLLFPISAYNKSVGNNKNHEKPILADEEGYPVLITFFWPVKAVLNLILLWGIGAWEVMKLVVAGADFLSRTADAGIQQAANGLGALRAHKNKKTKQLKSPDPQPLPPDWEEECELLVSMEREMEALGERVAAKRKELAKLTPDNPFRHQRKK